MPGEKNSNTMVPIEISPALSLARTGLSRSGTGRLLPSCQSFAQPWVRRGGRVDEAPRRHVAPADGQAMPERLRAVAAEALVRPAERVRRHDHVVELQDRVRHRRRL